MQMGSKNQSKSVCKLRQNCLTKIMSESYVRLTLESYVIKPCNWNQKVT